MAQILIIAISSLLILLQILSANADHDHSLSTYIVHVEPPYNLFDSQESLDLEKWYLSFLPETANSTDRILYSYKNVFSGFAAKLSENEVEFIQQKKGFISATPQRVLQLHTTRSPEFLGLHRNSGLWSDSNYGKGVIIGVLDTGIFPNHPSFNADGMPPPPPSWKGKCEFNFTACNNKLIGARNFIDGEDGPMDHNGHGTHSASTAAGRFVDNASVYGNANGTAAGVAPMAHLAIYKSCTDDCLESDVLAAMDAAIDDEVDVISISFGGFSREYYDDNIALGAYSAIQRGIFVSCSAGNNGPFHTTLSNEAPWILTVGASTIDRKIRATAILGNGIQIDGESAFQPANWSPEQIPLIFPAANTTNHASYYCSSESLSNTFVKGKIVLCSVDTRTTKIEQGRAVRDAGGVAMILMNSEYEGFATSAVAHLIPATNIDYTDGETIISYINSTIFGIGIPTAGISFKGTVIDKKSVPMVTPFSSRGPSYLSPGILKPDIISPGANIIGAWPDNKFNIMSGTSVSSAHLAGVAALIKNQHPNWSPAAIKSAIMTTADVYTIQNQTIPDENLHPADIFSMGSGQVNPTRASNPGLVYDIQPDDYIPYLCGLNYTNREVSKILLQRANCSYSIPESQLNYPSFAIRFGESEQRFVRTVMNVGEDRESYVVEIVAPDGIRVRVNPERLDFSRRNEKLKYEAVFSVATNDDVMNKVSQGFIVWKSEKHFVRSHFAASDY